MLRICFVCSGNICRSPSAEVVLRSLAGEAGVADRLSITSAGIGDWHVGETADRRSLRELSARGYDGSTHRARLFGREWFADHDLVVAMDRGHLRALRRLAPPGQGEKIRLLRSFVPGAAEDDVPDPYYGGDDGFAHVLDLIEEACRALLAEVRPRLCS